MDALERVNILDKYDQRSDQLSGGQQQRISIARALCQEPTIILADEPVASLDPLTTKQVMDDLKKINEELGITILINLHFVDPLTTKQVMDDLKKINEELGITILINLHFVDWQRNTDRE